jgi:hypothetical protein
MFQNCRTLPVNFTRYPAIDCPTVDFTNRSISPLADCSSHDPPLSCCSFALFDATPPRLLSLYRSSLLQSHTGTLHQASTKLRTHLHPSKALLDARKANVEATGAPNRHSISFQHHLLRHPNHYLEEPLVQTAS